MVFNDEGFEVVVEIVFFYRGGEIVEHVANRRKKGEKTQ